MCLKRVEWVLGWGPKVPSGIKKRERKSDLDLKL